MNSEPDQSSQNLPENTESLLESIKEMLSRSKAADWKSGGEPLDTQRKFKQATREWHRVFCISIGEEVLVVRSAQEVKANFGGFGFTLLPAGAPQFFVEMRAFGWHPEILTNPFRRTEFSNQQCDVLASGPVAREIFEYTRQCYESRQKERRSLFQEQVQDRLENIDQLFQSHILANWRRVSQRGGMSYQLSIGDWEIAIFQERRADIDIYGLRLESDGQVFETDDFRITRPLYNKIEQVSRVAGLRTVREALSKIV